MPAVEAGPDPVPAKVERVLVSQQEAVVILSTDSPDYDGRVLPVFVDLGQAMNIQVSLEGRMVGRPLTHDLVTTILNQLNASIDRVIIEEIAQNTFFANLILEYEHNGSRDKVTFDARPSDGIALAVRAGSPILVRRKVLDAAAVERDRLFGAGIPDDLEFEVEGEENEDDDEADDDDDGSGGGPPERLDPGDLERP